MGWFSDTPGDKMKKQALEREAAQKAAKAKLPKKGSRKRVSAKGKTAKWILAELRAGRTVTGYEPWSAENLGDAQVQNVSIKSIEAQQRKLGSLESEGTFQNTRRGSIKDTAAELRGKPQLDKNGRRLPPAGANGGGPRNEDGSARSTWW